MASPRAADAIGAIERIGRCSVPRCASISQHILVWVAWDRICCVPCTQQILRTLPARHRLISILISNELGWRLWQCEPYYLENESMTIWKMINRRPARVILAICALLMLAAGLPPGAAQARQVVEPQSAWKYNDSGKDLGTAWRARSMMIRLGNRAWPRLATAIQM